ncbi:MAG TPA: hypothetical protein VFT98_20225 [Myxococcota bacterium]|nr:hypothetical protein [Myxococcota bacterium]
MIEDADCLQDLADAIAKYEGWIMSPDERRRRIRQCLKGHAGRRFCIEWAPIAIRVVTEHGGDDLIIGVLDAARRDGLYGRMKAPMARVSPEIERDRRMRG